MHLPHMLIGGYALPAYGQIRATQDLDMAIAADYAMTVRLHTRLKQLGYQIPSPPHKDASMFFVTDLDNMLEIELWIKPDGVSFDKQLLRRRVKVRPFGDEFEIFAIGPEDFIINKLARKDRGVQDERDVVSVLRLQKGKLDYSYLYKRARAAKISEMLETIMAKLN